MKNLVMTLLLLPFVASAKPGPVSRYLIDEPASMMDMGIWRMGQTLAADRLSVGREFEQAAGFELASLVVAARYDFDNDFVVVPITAIAKSESPLKVTYGGLETGCTETIKYIASRIGHEHLYKFFTHSGYNFGSQPESMGETLAARTKFQCNASDSIGDIAVVVERLLEEEEISVNRKGSADSE